MTERELRELLNDRIEIPIFDESIFYPERVVKELGFTDEDINEITEFVRWHINQRNRGLELKRLVAVLRTRLDQLKSQRKMDILREFEMIEHLNQ